jgi:hypothetical protein
MRGRTERGRPKKKRWPQRRKMLRRFCYSFVKA